MVWLSTITGLLQVFVVILLVREIFGIRYDTGKKGDTNWEERRDSVESGQGRARGSHEAVDDERRGVENDGRDQVAAPDEGELDDVADDEESLRLTFDDMEDVGNNLVNVFQALTDAVENESFARAQALAAQGADLVSGESSRSKSVEALLDQRSGLVKDATSRLEEVKEELENNLIVLSDEATVKPMANMHESRADGLFYSDVKALEDVPEGFFQEKLDEYEAASTDEERVRTWKEAYQVMSQLPQFYPPDWTDPRDADDVVGKTVRVDGEERDKLRHELKRMIKRYDLVNEHVSEDIEVDESHRKAERELNLVHEAIGIVEQHQRLLEQVGENYDAGDVTIGTDENDNAVSLGAVADQLGEQFRSVYQSAKSATSSDDVDVSPLEDLLRVFVQSVNQVHEALNIYTSNESKEDTINDLKGVAEELREQRRHQ